MPDVKKLRDEDAKRPRGRRRYPTSRVHQILWVLIALLVVSWVVSQIF